MAWGDLRVDLGRLGMIWGDNFKKLNNPRSPKGPPASHNQGAPHHQGAPRAPVAAAPPAQPVVRF